MSVLTCLKHVFTSAFPSIDCNMAASSSAVLPRQEDEWLDGVACMAALIQSQRKRCSSAEAPSFQQRAAARPERNLLECSLLLRPYQRKRVQQALLHELAIAKHLTFFGAIL